MFSVEQEFTLRNGRVPAKKKTVKRHALLEKLYAHLQAQICGKNQWLVIYGMPGTGKTQLVIDLLWDRPEIVFGHFNKIFWLTDRNIDPNRITDVATDALIMLSRTVDNATPKTLQSIGQLFHAKLIELECTSKILLVLDGVMLADTVRFFDNNKSKNCYFLAMTTSREVFSCVQDAIFFEINSNNTLQRDQLRELAGHYKLSNLTNAQLDVLSDVSGNNLAVLEKLLYAANGNIQIIPSLLHRLKFRPLNELSCTSQYLYPSMEIPLNLCFRMLDERISVAFENLTVLQPSKWTSLNGQEEGEGLVELENERTRHLLKTIVCLNWPMDLCGSETDAEVRGMVLQDLRQLTYNSLLDECHKDRLEGEFGEDDFYYKINPVVHSYLLHSRPGGYIKFMKSLSHLTGKVQDQSEGEDSGLKEYYLRNQENLRKTEKYVGIMLERRKQRKQENTSKYGKQENNWTCNFLLFLGSAFQRLLGA